MSLVRIVAHDVAHVHLDIKLFKVDANTTSVSHGEPCGAPAFPLRNDGVEVLVTESVENTQTHH